MKLAIVTLILLTLILGVPPLYTHWAESRRQQQIQEIKQQARLPMGDTLDTVLTVLNGEEPPSVVILYTGGTQSHLEPCGCYQEQSGGLPRRAYVVEQIRQQGLPTFLVDAGDLFDGTEPLDAQRCQVNLQAMSIMGYDAVALSQNDLGYADAYLSAQRAVASFPFLAQNSRHAQSSVVQTAGGMSIVFIPAAGSGLQTPPTKSGLQTPPTRIPSGLQTPPTKSGLQTPPTGTRVHPDADVLIALGTSASAELPGIDVVISPTEGEPMQQTGAPLWVGSTPEGKTLGFLALWVNAKGELTRHHATHLALTGDVAEDESVRQRLTDFY